MDIDVLSERSWAADLIRPAVAAVTWRRVLGTRCAECVGVLFDLSMGIDSAVSTSWLDDREQAAWRGWLDTYRLLLPALDRQLQTDSQASLTDFEVLVHLSEAPQRRLRMSELADRAVATRSAITRTVDRLAARGWVRRSRVDEDQRGYFADLTELGASQLAKMAPGHVATVRSYLIDLLDDDELAALRSIGAKVRRQMGGSRDAS